MLDYNLPLEILGGESRIQETRYAIVAMYALLMYEWICGLEKENRLVSCARWNSAKIAYLLCRYYPLLLWPVIMWGYLINHTESTCDRVGKPLHAILAPCQFFSQAVMFMRAYAFSGRSRRVLVVLGTCYAALIGVDIWAFCIGVTMPPSQFYDLLRNTGCFPNYGLGVMGMRIGFSMLAAILMDLVSLISVLIYCRKVNNCGVGSLACYFVKQGLNAFVVVTAVNVAAAIAFFKPPSYNTGIGLPLVLIVPNVVACRVILGLRTKASPTDTEIWRQHSLLINGALATKEGSTKRDIWLMDKQLEDDFPNR